jgi:hypothetical protein
MAGNQQQGTPSAGGIRTIRLPAVETRPRELDGNMRSWGRSGERPQPARDKSAEREAGS